MLDSYNEKMDAYNKQVNALRDSEIPYKQDYALLVNQESRICQVIALFDELVDENDLLGTSFRHIIDLHTSNVSFPDMENLTDFSLAYSAGNSLASNFDSYVHNLKKVCKEIDDKKKEIGQKLNSIENEISGIEKPSMPDLHI